jgi:hypothetical protein
MYAIEKSLQSLEVALALHHNQFRFPSLPCTCSTRPTMNTQASPPAVQSTEVMANGIKKFPVRSTTNPVRAGPTTPAKLAKPFCAPYHLPTLCGPANLWAPTLGHHSQTLSGTRVDVVTESSSKKATPRIRRCLESSASPLVQQIPVRRRLSRWQATRAEIRLRGSD